jgi:lysozyme
MKKRIVAGSAAALLAVSLIGHYEGLSLKPYRDIVGVKTWCYGETRGVAKSIYTKAECDAMFLKALGEFETQYRSCLPDGIMDDPKKVPDTAYVAFLSLSYNIGSGAKAKKGGFCNSSAAKQLKIGNVKAACYALTLYDKAGGKTVKGLANRRADELKHCLKGL